MEKVWVFYGKTEGLTGRAEAKGEKGRLETRAGRVLLAHALKKLYGLSVPDGEEGAAQLERMLTKGENGKPYLHGYPEIHFNISHSGAYAVCALAGIPVGIDIQIRQPVRGKRLLERTMNCPGTGSDQKRQRPRNGICIFLGQEGELSQMERGGNHQGPLKTVHGRCCHGGNSGGRGIRLPGLYGSSVFL